MVTECSLAPPMGSPTGEGVNVLPAHPAPLSLLADPDPALAANKQLVFDMWRGIVNAGHVELADQMLAVGYIQHSPVISTGREAFRQVFSTVPRIDVPEVVSPPLVTILAEGNLVVMVLREELPAGPGRRPFATAHFNLFRVAEGKLAEHWHSVELPPRPAVPPPDEGGPQPAVGSVGPAQLALLKADDPHVAANKRLVFDARREVFDAGHESAAERLVSADYVEHDPNFPSGRGALVARLSERPDSATAKFVTAPVVAVVGQGDLVVMVTAREHPHPLRPGATYTTTGFEMYRIADDRIAEHWTGDALKGAPPPVY